MPRQIFLSLPIALLLSTTTALAGIPTSEQKWAQANENWSIDTEDVDMDGKHIRFYVERTSTEGEHAAEGSRWTGKIRVSCEDFHSRIEVQGGAWGGYYKQPWQKIKPSEFAHILASNFCFLTNVPGYTPEPNPEEWVTKIINTIKSQPIKDTKKKRCESSTQKNKPECRKYR